jgi:large subunit ribosomal protein L17
MRHGDKVNNLGRTAAHRRAMLANMAASLIEHKRISTTLAKAKALRRYVEPLVTKAKDNSTHSRRVVFGYLQSKEAVAELFGPVAEKIGERPGGYLRVIKLGFRRGDGAETALIEFVDFNEVYNPNAGKTKTTKKTRRGSGTRKPGTPASTAETAAVATAPVVEETVVEAVAEPVEEVAVEMEAAAEETVAEVETAAAEVSDAVSEAAEEATEEKKEDEQA